jgi:iron complex transport system substrate-binding protein
MKHRWLIAATCATALAVTGCGSDSTTATTAANPATTAAPTTVASATTSGTASSTTSASPTVAAATTSGPSPAAGSTPSTPSETVTPSRIISLSSTATEMLFAIGAGDQVIAVDQFSDYPAAALHKPHDLDGTQPNVEAIAKLEPDLVIVSYDADGIVGQLQSLHIATWVGDAAATFDDVFTQIEQLGATTGHVADAAKVVADMHTDIAAAVAAVPAGTKGLTYYHELEDTYYSVTSHTFAGAVYNLFGLVNIADAGPAGNPYPQLSSEFIVTQSPALIFLADTKCCGQSPQTVAARPGWDTITAVKDGVGVVALDDDIASRWGPRIVDYIEAVSAALAKVPAPAG